ncbi:MAG: hypothetical protein U9Q66_01370 [Patescibacteria group bacterium]|nr:hypothetical protein [Patescibacteria group bacterium]
MKNIKTFITNEENIEAKISTKHFENITKLKIENIKTTQDFSEKIEKYIQKNTQETKIANERLKEITDQLFNEDRIISQNEVIDIISEVSDIM